MDPSVTKTPLLISDFFDLFLKLALVFSPQAISNSRSVGPHQAACSSFASSVLLYQHLRACLFCLWGYHFREFTSFRATMSRLSSATILFSLEFSASRALKRLASEMVIPPNFAFQL